ncbi:TonB-dependent receptor [Caulobacter sp. Root487D2Y]|uniref:TonB-dependent receptor n=1 Tax=Caulobacter sp. Root487D2Y TaxID=1736547 RepID=UPI0006FF978C|nr:TonB-dependent receptor [Caulobacter sp. Root487D2Y]KQY29862.1 TonB-dependent receptor [Caulobacter sp. Root487D2Y]
MSRLAYTASLLALMAATTPAFAQTNAAPRETANVNSVDEVVVTATRRSERLQDVPLSITAFSQAELTQKGVVGFEGIARETPGVVLNRASDNNARFTVRGISTNGWGAGLQTTTTIYLDELPLSTIGNTVTLDPALYDVERVEFLRGPQGTLFGSGSLSGALRVLTKSPDLTAYDASVLADIGYTPDGEGVRQRYNAMVNVPLVEHTLGLRVVGFYRNEDGFVDNLGTGVKNANALTDWGGRAILLWKPNDRLSVRLLASYEDSDPMDSSLTTPSLGDRKRYSTIPDQYTSKTQIYNGTLEYQFDGARLTSSSTYSIADSLFNVDLAGTFNLAVPFYLYDGFQSKTFVQETRLASDTGGRFDWVAGGFYLHRDTDLNGEDRSSAVYLAAHHIAGLPGTTFAKFGSDTRTYELAAFGELTYHLTDKLSATGGLRYGKYGGEVDVYPGFNTAYFTYALFGISGPLTLAPSAASTAKYPSAEKASWKASLSYRPSRGLTTYATVSTGYRTPVYNGRAGSVSTVDPTDLVIPTGAGSDNLINYEVGVKGRWLDGKLTANLAAYYIDWKNIQVQANRQSDSVQFATNVGRAASKGLEAEVTFAPAPGWVLGVNGSLNNAKVTELSPQEATISGAVDGARLASPHVQGSLFGTYSYALGGQATGFTSIQVQHVGSFPNGFPNTPGKAGVRSPLYDTTDSYTYVNLQTGTRFGKWNAMLYGENLGNSRATTYIHPEAFVYSRYAIVRPRTFGVRLGYEY